MNEIERITSRDNRRLINARKVRDGKVRDLIFIEGKRLVEEAMRSNIQIDECFVTDKFAASETGTELLDALVRKPSRCAQMTDSIFGSIADTDHSQGIILLGKRPKSNTPAIEARLSATGNRMRMVIFFSEANNPSNLGAILRTAEAAGVCGVVVSRNSADAFSPKALRAAMGSSFRLPVWENAEFDEVIAWAAEGKLTITAADTKARRVFTDADWKQPRLLVLGSEAHGLSDSELERIDEKVRIPMENQVESLNLAVSAGIILFEAKRQNA